MKIKFPVLMLAYGANTNRNHMKVRCPGSKYIGNATLKGYELAFRGVADVIANPAAETECALWSLTKRDLDALDRFEGYPTFYGRRFAKLKINGVERYALFYFMAGTRVDFYEPPQSYEHTLRTGYRQCGMNERQIDEAIIRAQTASTREKRYRGKWVRRDIEAKQRNEQSQLQAESDGFAMTDYERNLENQLLRQQDSLFKSYSSAYRAAHKRSASNE